MEEVHPRRSSGRRKHKRRTSSYQTPYSLSSDDSDDMMMVDAVDMQAHTSSFRRITKYYTVLFLKVGIWSVFAWALSHLHLRAPYFLLLVPIWLYSGRMCAALNWVKRRLRGPVA